MPHSFLPSTRALAIVVALGFTIAPLPGWAQSDRQDANAGKALEASRVAAEAPFLAENNTAMDTMMAGMNVKPTGDVDVDFAAMMIPHHQGAIDMALSELRYGKNEQLRRIAQEIIVEQQQEINAMHIALGQSLPAQTAAQTQIAPAPETVPHDQASMGKNGMSMPQPTPVKQKD